MAFDPTISQEWAAIKEARTAKPLGKSVEWAFSMTHPETGEKRDFYKFRDDMDRPPLRSMNWHAKLTELSMGVTRPTLEDFVKEIRAMLNGSKGEIQLTKIHELMYELQLRMHLLPDPDMVYQLAAVEYFSLDETLTDFVYPEQKAKIDFWKACKDDLAFFLSKPIKELIGLGKISKSDLVNQLKMRELEIAHQLRRNGFWQNAKSNSK